MRKVKVPVPALVAIAATRGMLGVGIGLLLASRIPLERRRALGWTLFGIGLASTVPLAAVVLRNQRELPSPSSMASSPV